MLVLKSVQTILVVVIPAVVIFRRQAELREAVRVSVSSMIRT